MQNARWLSAMTMWAAASAVLGAGEPVPADSGPAPARRMLERALAGPLAGCRELVFAVRSVGSDGHYYANFGYYDNAPDKWAYGPGGGQLCKLDLHTGNLSVLLDDPQGGVRDPCVHYDGRKLVFSYRPGGTHHYHLFEIGTDGQGLRQLTDGPYDDIEPIYLPDDSLVFGSSRCDRWVACWYTQVAILYRCDPDGGNVRMLSSSIVHDNTPWMLPDGRLLYTRWEYVDRSRVRYHHLWTVRPDGTGQMVYFGNLHGGDVMIDAKPIPGTDQVACIFSPGHGQPEHAGRMTVVDPRGGPDCRPRPGRSVAPPTFATRIRWTPTAFCWPGEARSCSWMAKETRKSFIGWSTPMPGCRCMSPGRCGAARASRAYPRPATASRRRASSSWPTSIRAGRWPVCVRVKSAVCSSSNNCPSR